MHTFFDHQFPLWRPFLSALPEWVIWTHSSGRTLWANPSLCSALEKKLEDVIGKLPSEFLILKNKQNQTWPLEACAAAGTCPTEEEVCAHLPSEKPVGVQIQKVHFPDQGGILFWMQPTVAVSPKEPTACLKASQGELMNLMAATVAHDLNNLLTAILGSLSLMNQQPDLSANLVRLLASAQTGAQRAQILTKEFLSFARKGRHPQTKQRIPLKPFLRESADLVLTTRKIPYTLSFDEKLWSIEMSESALCQVVTNLLVNAAQASTGSGRVYVTARNHEQTSHQEGLNKGPYVKISVRDEGIGISAEHLSRLFTPYFTTKKEGNGLGLASCLGIIKENGGTIRVQSQEGKGANFDVYIPSDRTLLEADQAPIPLVAPPAQVLPAPESVSPASLAAPRLGGVPAAASKPRVLILDDEEVIQQICAEMLEHLGYQSAFASEGTQALNLYIESKRNGAPFDVVILDLAIPGGKGGKEIIGELRRYDPNICALVSSGYLNDPVIENYAAFGFKGCLLKPYNLEQLRNVLKSLCQRIE